jgi:hypothetical protein
MQTISNLLEIRAIVKLEVPLAPRQQPKRLLYGTPDFVEWLTRIMCGDEPSNRLGDATPSEQIDHLFHIYLSGLPMEFTRQFRMIRAEENAVWELKTPDIRVFGWFIEKDCFVAVFGDWADRVKEHDLYRGYRIAIRRLRRELNIDNNLCVQGVSPSDVLSI